MNGSRPGQALAATLEEPGFYAGDPFPHYARLAPRGAARVERGVGLLGGGQARRRRGDLTRSRDVLLGQRNPHVRDRRGVPESADDDAHRSARPHALPQARAAGLRAVANAGARNACRARADELVARVEPGVAFDAVETLAVPFPLWIIAELLGIPESDWPRFYDWSEASIPGATDWPPEECARLQAEMHEYLLETTRARRGDPRDDIISVLAEAEVDGESLRDDELVMFLNQLLVAGNETTRHAISGGIAALAERPEQWQRLVDDRSLLDTATEEVLRWTTPVISFMRTATRDTEIRGVEIAAGDPLLLLYASANRDEDEFGANADEFDVGRDPEPRSRVGVRPALLPRRRARAHRDLRHARRAPRPVHGSPSRR